MCSNDCNGCSGHKATLVSTDATTITIQVDDLFFNELDSNRVAQTDPHTLRSILADALWAYRETKMLQANRESNQGNDRSESYHHRKAMVAETLRTAILLPCSTIQKPEYSPDPFPNGIVAEYEEEPFLLS
jgi:hypothetical protein